MVFDGSCSLFKSPAVFVVVFVLNLYRCVVQSFQVSRISSSINIHFNQKGESTCRKLIPQQFMTLQLFSIEVDNKIKRPGVTETGTQTL